MVSFTPNPSFDLKKWMIREYCEWKYGCAYIYAYEGFDEPPYRFRFRVFSSPGMWRIVHELKKRGFRISIWRPPGPR